MSETSVYKKAQDYYTERYKEFQEAFEILRQDLVNDLGYEFRRLGIPATFTIRVEGMSMSVTTPHEIELLDALIGGNEAEIEAAFEKYRAAFEVQRMENRSDDDD